MEIREEKLKNVAMKAQGKRGKKKRKKKIIINLCFLPQNKSNIRKNIINNENTTHT